MTTKVKITAEIHQSDRRVRVTQLLGDGNEYSPNYISATDDSVELYVHSGHGIKVVEEQQGADGDWVAG